MSFTITDEDGTAVDVSTADLTLEVKKQWTNGTVITINDASFDKTDAASGIVLAPFSSANTNKNTGTYTAELTVYFSSNNISKYQFEIIIIAEV